MSNSKERVRSSVHKALGYVSIHGTVALCAIGIFGGYLLGWHMQAHPDRTAISFIVAIVLGFLLRVPVKMWMDWIDKKPAEEIVDAVMQDLNVPDEPEPKPEPKPKKQKPKKPNKNHFSQDDFDDRSRAVLLSMVKKARKSGAKVTEQGLYTTILESIH